ncbi:MFS transporter [Pseudohoeflea coraliihabitans]|uniref:MFS transporter n=1 Tax=Pseudohoeflea coraliihabitans TaxID=2860393 RepID=A0ABS6WJE7_9HYPH|nr:MFS transporter [Pseudohoeflea sp. DP4N28-3]MBW3096066.1 MFS transporter [Pseudohoeflea sp. DP4N28-3]
MDRRISVIGLGAFAVSTIAFVFAGLLPLIASDIGVSVSQAGYLATAYATAYAVLTPVMTALGGRFNRRHVLAAALALFIAGTVLTAVSTTIVMLVLAQIVTGMAAGLFSATGLAVAVTLSAPQRRAAAISIVVAGTTLAVAVGAPLGSLVAHLLGWRMAFAAIAAMALSCLIILWLQLPKTLHGARVPLRERLAVVRRPGIARLLSTTFCTVSGAFAVVVYIGPIAIEGVHFAPDVLPFVLLAYGIGSISGNIISGRVADRIGARRVVIAALALSIGVALALAMVVAFLPPRVAQPVLLVLLFLWGLIGWAYSPAQTTRVVTAAPEAAHLSLALQMSITYLAIATGTFLGGRVLDSAPIAVLGLVAAVLAGLALVLVVTERRPVPGLAPVRL